MPDLPPDDPFPVLSALLAERFAYLTQGLIHYRGFPAKTWALRSTLQTKEHIYAPLAARDHSAPYRARFPSLSPEENGGIIRQVDLALVEAWPRPRVTLASGDGQMRVVGDDRPARPVDVALRRTADAQLWWTGPDHDGEKLALIVGGRHARRWRTCRTGGRKRATGVGAPLAHVALGPQREVSGRKRRRALPDPRPGLGLPARSVPGVSPRTRIYRRRGAWPARGPAALDREAAVRRVRSACAAPPQQRWPVAPADTLEGAAEAQAPARRVERSAGRLVKILPVRLALSCVRE